MFELKRRLHNILIGLDQFVQVLVYCGNYTPDETISGVIGRKVKKKQANFIEKGICYFLRKLESHHCVNSIDYQEAVRGKVYE